MSNMDRIMLKFRPIAPKPSSVEGSVPGGSSVGVRAKTGRGKGRGQARNRRNNCCRITLEKEDSGGSGTGGEKDIRTLRLLPEEPGGMENWKTATTTTKNLYYPLWLTCGDAAEGRRTMADPAEMEGCAVRSWVKVERVTDSWVAMGIWGTDEEKVMGLHQDTCPGFVSDELCRVRWTNAAYRRMVAEEGEVEACVVVERGVALPVGCAGFTCRARVVTWGNEKEAKTVPCDVWRMDCGGLAWRLDTAAALSLWIGE